MNVIAICHKDKDGFKHVISLNDEYLVFRSTEAANKKAACIKEILEGKIKGKVTKKRGRFWPFIKEYVDHVTPYPEHEVIWAKQVLNTMFIEERKLI